MNETLIALLRTVDTPTVCNAIEVAQGRRGFQGFTRGTMVCTAPEAPPVVGYAVTAQIAGAAPSEDPPEIVRKRRMAYYRAMHDAAKPAVAVVEDTDFPHCVSAYWGEVNTTVHKAFGMAGAVTNGVVRDLGDLPEAFPVIAGSIGPSHAFVHVTSIGEPVEIFGLRICQGDLIHADRHGAVVIPTEVLPVLDEAIRRLQASENLILAPARRPGFTFEQFEVAWAEFERART